MPLLSRVIKRPIINVTNHEKIGVIFMTDENTAYLISGTMREGRETTHIIGLLFAPDPPGKKMLDRMGFVGLQTSVDTVKIQGTKPEYALFFYFERGSPTSQIKIAKMAPNGSLSDVKAASVAEIQTLPLMSAPPTVLAKFKLPNEFVIRESIPPAPRQSAPPPQPREVGERRSSNPGERRSHPPRQQR